MDPVTLGLLAAVAGGTGGEIGRDAWAALRALVQRSRPSRHQAPGVAHPDDEASNTAVAPDPGEDAMDALEAQADDPALARRLLDILASRAAAEPDFEAALALWARGAASGVAAEGVVHNQVSGGVQYGPVLQGREFSGISFTVTTPSPPPAPAPDEGSTPARG